MAEYRWHGRLEGRCRPEGGHGYFRVREDEERYPLWAVRSLPGPDGGVRLGHLGASGGAFVGESEQEQGENVDEYEVLLDEGMWAPSQADDLGAAGALACGRLGDGTPLYLSLGDPWGEGAKAPLEAQGQNDWHYPRQVLMAPGAASTGPGELKWKTASVWNDKGDTAFLKDPSGELVASMKA